MSIFSAVFSRSADGWTGTEVDLTDVEGIDDVADLMRDIAAAHDPGAAEDTMLLLAEADDEWFGIVRVDDRADPRVFLSDARMVHGYPIAALLLEDTVAVAAGDEEEERGGQRPYPDPGGDAGLLVDLGTPEETLLALTLREGVLPADALATIADHAGFADALDALRA
ncbi:tRNA adenosine deaminase-associated protein [Marinactinospora thermotolerans]|uniref:Putative tRNA adenosine deaminase-associated protein n=1 Tax=Marinactinospora thermotolerans DSM 45154 TaxID=1122192 RepID=A0A1T4RCS0_9ACTN|nr:tRNA adenosine deaminase-associated protein [Marinactinospora thermotolerans]SKA13538.1 putative tRNA adenosine deaminase-associated protein [Marinactinospora thermotolerans DSM 45154]